jgi:uncharacterized RDD family membrane protein YckC
MEWIGLSRRQTITIETPEGIRFPLVIASPILRFLAWAIDLAAITVLTTLISIPLGLLSLLSLDVAGAVVMLLYFAISIGYAILLEWFWRGQTLGKRLLRLRVVDQQGLRLEFSQVVLRNLLRFVDMLPGFYLIGGLSCLISRCGQRWGDYAGNTVVIRNIRPVAYDIATITSGKYNSFRNYPQLEARLRQRVKPELARLTMAALLRRESLEPAARLELFAEMAAYFRAEVEFPEEACFGLTDEQYIRNVLDSLYRQRSVVGGRKLGDAMGNT